MPVPDYQSLMLPLLESVVDGQPHELREIRELIASRFRLTDAERAELLPSGQQPVFDNRLGWAKTYLEKAGLLHTIKRGVYEITSGGHAALAKKPAKIDIAFLSEFPSFAEFRSRTAATATEPSASPQLEVPGAITPSEALEGAYQQLRANLTSELLAHVQRSSPSFFERLVVDLLVKMGYGGSIRDAGQAVGRSGDGGVDGIIKQDPLGLDVIYVQAKRWQNNVGRPEIQAFAGSLEGERARKGVFITTSRFSAEARQYVGRIEKKVVLIDGEQLASLMIDHELGVNLTDTYQIKRVDTDYFSEED